jgi:hypothetical protein
MADYCLQNLLYEEESPVKKSRMDSYASEYCMSGSDNALSREQIQKSIVSKATTNEGEYRKAMEKGIEEIH